MSTTPIARPLYGERVVALSPENATAAATDWLRRPNMFPSRALTAPTLQGLQRWQAGRIATRGQAYTPGVVAGFEVSYVFEDDAMRVRVTPGRGLAVTGEDVALTQPADVNFADLPVVAEPAVFVAGAAGGSGSGTTGVLRPRVIGATRLGPLVATRPGILPTVGVLVLQPVSFDRGDVDPTDPCDHHPCAEAGTDLTLASFEDRRISDAARLLWYAWPEEWRAAPPDGPRRRNVLAHLIFDGEAALEAGAALPWEQWGVPLALIGVNESWQPAFADRAAVVRRGGRARDARLALAAGASRLAASSRLPALWQARIEQLAQEVVEMGEPAPAPAELVRSFERLPPVGLLPANVLNLDALPLASTAVLRSEFFPAGFELDAVPVPLEQLDVAIREAASLATLDLSAGERVRVLVPVSQASFEPRLLHQEAVASEFQQTLDRFLLDRARALGVRQGLRTKVSALAAAITGRALPVPAIAGDPLALEPESLALPPAGGGHRAPVADGLHQHSFDDVTEDMILATDDAPYADQDLFAWVYLDPDHPPRTLMLQWRATTSPGNWEHRAYWGENLIELGTDGAPSRLRIGDLPPLGRWVFLTVSTSAVGLGPGAVIDGMAFTLFDGGCAYGRSGLYSNGTEVQQVWTSQVLPTGAQQHGDYPWELLTDTDLWAPFGPAFGLAVPSVPGGGGHVEPAASGTHEHFFITESSTVPVPSTSQLFAWVWLDPVNPPRTLMLQWYSGGNWDHRAYWGENLIAVGVDGSVSRRRMGGLPPLGRWVRLAVPAASVGLNSATLAGMAFTLFDGRAAFGAAGRLFTNGHEHDWVSASAVLPWATLTPPAWTRLTPGQMTAPLADQPSGAVSAIDALQSDPAIAPLSGRERAQLAARGLAGFIAYLTSRADRADDLVDYGFIKVQTDVYRLRNLAFETLDSTRLAISPTLAAIATGDTAVAAQAQLASFFNKMRPPSQASASVAAVPSGLAGADRTAPPAAFDAGTASRSARSVMADAPPSAPPAEPQRMSATSGVAVDPRTGRLRELEPIELDTFLNLNAAFLPVGAQTELIPFIAPSRGTTTDVIYASPVVGKAQVRTTAIAKRLGDPKATEAKDYAAATRHEAVTALLRLADELRAEDGGVTPALFEGIDVHGVEGDPFLGTQALRHVPLTEFIPQANRAVLLGSLLLTPTGIASVPMLPDESAHFSLTADISDNTVALFRQLEGHIRLYRDAIAAAERTLNGLKNDVAEAEARLTATGDAVAEARHDVSVARALLAEETERIDGINQHRRDVIAQEVRFLAFMRPRETDNLALAPLRNLDPGLIDPPAPACLREHHDLPDELSDMLRVVREAPARWFVEGRPLFERLDRTDLLVQVLQTAQQHVSVSPVLPVLPFATLDTFTATPAAAPANGLAAAISRVRQAQFQVVSQVRAPAARIDVRRARELTWRAARDQAEQVVSLGDLIDGGNRRGDVVRRTAEILEQIGQIAACLHAELSAVLPSIRLDWAELLSQFDQAPNLRNLGGLRRWAEIPYVDRRQMQGYADWLFARIDPGEPLADSLMSDVIRMCLLLASHAPVGRIIAGRLARPVTARPGVPIPLTVFEPAKLRLGMQALVYRGADVVARAVVEDIGTMEVSARVIQTSGAQEVLDAGTRVQFAEPTQVSLVAKGRSLRETH